MSMDGGQSEVSSLVIEEFGDFSEIETTEDLQDISLLEEDKNIGENFDVAKKSKIWFKSSEVQLIEELEGGKDSVSTNEVIVTKRQGVLADKDTDRRNSCPTKIGIQTAGLLDDHKRTLINDWYAMYNDWEERSEKE